MMYLVIALLVFALSGAATTQAQPSQPEQAARLVKAKGPLFTYKQPIRLDDGTSRLMHVTFNHTSHKNVKCVTCHHEGLPGNRYASCTNELCHSIRGASERDPMSLFMAYHAPDERSCYGCHRKEAANRPDFRGCRPCHMSPQTRIVIEKIPQEAAMP